MPPRNQRCRRSAAPPPDADDDDADDDVDDDGDADDGDGGGDDGAVDCGAISPRTRASKRAGGQASERTRGRAGEIAMLLVVDTIRDRHSLDLPRRRVAIELVSRQLPDAPRCDLAEYLRRREVAR
jgi:hypothetical protein